MLNEDVIILIAVGLMSAVLLFYEYRNCKKMWKVEVIKSLDKVYKKGRR